MTSVKIEVSKLVDYFHFHSSAHLIRMCIKALEIVMEKGQMIEWPPAFVTRKAR